MKNNNTPKRNSLPFTAVLIGATVLSGIFMFSQSHTRQYSSGLPVVKDNDREGALGMVDYFFNARKNASTGKMDYASMAASNAAALKMMGSASTARSASTISMNWSSMGPTNIGGRTRGILIDNLDPTHKTLFACAVSGGIWKSLNAGGTWDSVPQNDGLASMEACCIAQDKNGVIYVGTGEGFSLYEGGDGFSTALLGGGIYKSTDDGKTFTVMANTVPPPNDWTKGWAYVNRIAIDPNNASNIYVATYGGLMGSSNGGTSWSTIKGGNCLDVKISEDGTLLLTNVNGIPYYAYPSGYVSTLTRLPSNIPTVAAGSNGRMEFAISPTNPNYAYLCAVINGNFGAGASKGTGVYFTMNAKSSGGKWYLIGPGGSTAFDPYSSGGSQDQGTYDNAMAVSPSNPGTILVGGTTIWTWSQASTSDTLGKWTSLTYYGGSPHPDQHVIVYDLLHPNVVYNGNDGGIYKSTNGGTSWTACNRNYNVTQFDALAFAPVMSPIAPGYNVAEGVMGGTQDNGTPYIGGYYPVYYMDAYGAGGGDGGTSAISQLDPNVFFVTSDNNSLFRGDNLNTAPWSSGNAYTNIIGDTAGANIDSVASRGGCFYHQIALYENSYDTSTPNTMLWIADSNYSAGKTVYPISPNGNLPFPYTLTANVNAGDTLIIKNPIVSKIAVGFTGATGVWLSMQATNLAQTAMWMPIGGPLSQPDPITAGGDPIHVLAWSPDGDALFIGTQTGYFYRLSNLNAIKDNQYTTGALFGMKHGGGAVANPKCVVLSKHITSFTPSIAGRDILGISVDPNNGNNVIVTLGNYGNSNNVYYSNNALSATPTFTSAQGNLPAMPVYCCVTDVVNSGYSKSALVGTEKGIWSTTDVTVPSPTWTFTNTGGANTLVMALKQQTLPPWNCNNSGNVYAGTHGRGAWVSTTFFKPLGVQNVAAAEEQVGVKVYPNPMTEKGTIEFTMPKTGNVTVTVFDLNGRVIKTVAMDNQAKGNHYVDLNAGNLSAGAYIATVSGDDFRKSVRFVVVK